jgi:3-oxoacyl-[acyl-carrier-protein] synthase II
MSTAANSAKISADSRSENQRVVITGLGLCSPVGDSLDEVSDALRTMRHGIAVMHEWDAVGQLATRLAAPVLTVKKADFPRKQIRTMGRVGMLSTFATDRAINDAGLDPELLSSGRVGLAYGSTHGSSSELEDFCRRLFDKTSFAGIEGSAYLKFMSHTAAANLAMLYSIRGRIITTCSACVSSSQAIGAGYEAVRAGLQDVMVCGGAEELHFTHAGVFDIMFATSNKYNEHPELSPRPFDAARDGLVVGEGAATVVVESLARARGRGARIYAEILGYGTNCDGLHVTRPSQEGMAGAMRLALADAGLRGEQMDYVNMHGTATDLCDIAEIHAAAQQYGTKVPVSSTKSYTAHTLGACGGIEAIFSLAMLRDGFVPPTRNLVDVDPRCAALDYVQHEPRDAKLDLIASNNFAFGGINTSLIFGRAPA